MTQISGLLRTATAPAEWPRWAALASIALILGAFAFEYIGRYPPCPMCITQRWIHAGAAAVGLGAFALFRFKPDTARYARYALLALAAIFTASAIYAARHAAIEYGFIAGPASCTASGGGADFSIDDLNAALGSAQNVVLCDEVAWSMFGISMAGWNALISACLAMVSVYAAARAPGGAS